MAKIICLAQSKGGTSKTTTAINLAACLVQNGYKVLAVDTDQQASLTVSLGINPSDNPKSMRALLTEINTKPSDILVHTQENIDLLPANVDLSLVEFYMPAVGRERVLDKKLRPFSKNYDFVVVDTPPSFAITTLNAMAASDYILVPFQPEPLCLLGMSQLTEAFELVRSNANPRLKILGLFITLYDSRVRYHRDIAEQIREDWKNQLFDTIIRRRSNVLEATLEGRSIVSLRANSEVAQDYQALAREVISRAK